MKKLLLLLCLLLCLSACGASDPKEVSDLPEGASYAIELVDEEGNPIVGALVSLCQNKEGGICYMPSYTNEEGIAYFHAELVPQQDDMKFRVLQAEGYELPLDENGDIRYTEIPDGAVHMIQLLKKLSN